MNSNSIVIAAIDGVDLLRDERSFYAKKPPAGFIFFKRNILEDSSNVLGLSKTCQLFDSLKSIIAIDQEGGRVSRLSTVINLGPCFDIEEGRVDEKSLSNIYSYGKTLGQELSKLGINVDFAPVLDIYNKDASLSIGDRCFSEDKDRVYLRAKAFYLGLEEWVLGCLKHFPGLGSSKLDTHTDVVTIDKSYEELFSEDIYPYQKIISEYPVKMVMVSHAVYSKIDPYFSASSSKIIIKDILREKLGYNGIVVSDDMLMKGCCRSDDIKDWQEAIVSSVVAGIDLLLVCKGLDRYRLAVEALDTEAGKSLAFRNILNESISKVVSLRKALL